MGLVIEETRRIPSEIDQVRNLVTEVATILEEAKLGSEDIYEVKTALTEALTNAVKCQPDRGHSAGQIWFKLDGQHLLVRVTDRGPGFDWDEAPDPTDPERLLLEGGRGVYLINHLMDRVEYDRESRTLIMEKHLSQPRRP